MADQTNAGAIRTDLIRAAIEQLGNVAIGRPQDAANAASVQLTALEAEVVRKDAEIGRLRKALVEFTEASNERDLALAIDSAIHSIDRDAAADTFTVYLFDYDADRGVGFTRRALIDALQDAKRYMREVPNVDDVGAEEARRLSDEWFARYLATLPTPERGGNDG